MSSDPDQEARLKRRREARVRAATSLHKRLKALRRLLQAKGALDQADQLQSSDPPAALAKAREALHQLRMRDVERTDPAAAASYARAALTYERLARSMGGPGLGQKALSEVLSTCDEVISKDPESAARLADAVSWLRQEIQARIGPAS